MCRKNESFSRARNPFFIFFSLLKEKAEHREEETFLLLLNFCKRSSWSSFDRKAFLRETERKWPQEKKETLWRSEFCYDIQTLLFLDTFSFLFDSILYSRLLSRSNFLD